MKCGDFRVIFSKWKTSINLQYKLEILRSGNSYHYKVKLAS